MNVARRVLELPAPGGTGPVEVTVLTAGELLGPGPPAWLPLVADDRERIGRLRRVGDVRRFLTGRALVARYAREELGGAVDGVRFVRRTTAAGEAKPRFEGWPGETVPDVSISHSGRHVVAAFCRTADVGVDVEELTAFGGPDDPAAEVFLTPAERDRATGRDQVAETFTGKEAVLKAVGWGFAVDPQRLELAGCAVRRFDAPQARPVHLARLAVPAGLAGAVAVAARVPAFPRAGWAPRV
ncbi:4'-phosphopantetheinyl transferase family protein [Kineococcus sp. SYSU DK001]|uniref:4'-phosphopantetheinyl transferase family protein n=1 Tax=Kineococcus sp. SYSU DK001 TaxID=3383122 RepID=UPI003D7DDB25